jgi:hypothetical protein
MALPVQAVTVVAVASLLAGGCGTPAGGDPRGRRLKELAADPVFRTQPPGVAKLHVTRTPARYTKPGFTSGGWRGPAVTATFTSAATTADVFRSFARRAAAAGWRATKRNVYGFADVWTKTYPDGAPATLLLLSAVPRARPVPRTVYYLHGGIAPVSG